MELPNKLRCPKCAKKGEKSNVGYRGGVTSTWTKSGYYGTDGEWVPVEWHGSESATFGCSNGHEFRMETVDGGEWKHCKPRLVA
jgi:hypothetical protein